MMAVKAKKRVATQEREILRGVRPQFNSALGLPGSPHPALHRWSIRLLTVTDAIEFSLTLKKPIGYDDCHFRPSRCQVVPTLDFRLFTRDGSFVFVDHTRGTLVVRPLDCSPIGLASRDCFDVAVRRVVELLDRCLAAGLDSDLTQAIWHDEYNKLRERVFARVVASHQSSSL